MRLKRHQEFLFESIAESFTLKFTEICYECDGTAEIKEEVICAICSGSGIYDIGTEDENGMYHDTEDCEHCEGKGNYYIESTCEACVEGKLEWNIDFRQGKGVDNLYEKYGSADQPGQYSNGNVSYNYPDRYPHQIKNIVVVIFDNKNLGTRDLINVVAKYLVKMEYCKDYTMSQDMIDLLDDDTKRLIQSSSVIHKFNI